MVGLNKTIFQKIRNDRNVGNKHRLIYYALDKDLFSDEDYNNFTAFLNNYNETPLNLSEHRYFCITALYWIRTFFNNGRGNDYKAVFKNNLSDSAQLRTRHYDFKKLIQSLLDRFDQANGFNPQIEVNLDLFLKQCWLVGGNTENGLTSQIWKFLLPLVRYIKNSNDDEFSNENLYFLVNEFIDRGEIRCPNFFYELTDELDVDFFESLRALTTGEGDGWLEPIKNLTSNFQTKAQPSHR